MNAVIGDVIVTDIPFCTRCAGTHAGIEAKKLRRPSFTYDEKGARERISYWSMCPVTNEPILATEVAMSEPPRRQKERP